MAILSASITSSVTIIATTLQDIYSILIIVFAGTGALLFSRILFLYSFRRNTGLRVRTFTRSMITYMAITVIGAGIVLLWRVCFVIYSKNLFKLGYAYPGVLLIKIVYDWLERGYFVSAGAMPLTVFFLALERCLAIQMPFKFSNNTVLERRLFALNVVGSIGISIIVYLINPWNLWPFKMTVGILNTLSCGFLVWKMKKAKSTTSDAIVITTIVIEICFEFFPNLLVFTIGKFPLGTIYMYTSSFPLVTQCLNVMICGIIYNVRFSARKKAKVITVSFQSTINVHNLSLAQPVNYQ